MIDRYKNATLTQIWSEEAKLLRWLDIVTVWAKERGDNQVYADLKTHRKTLDAFLFREEVEREEVATNHDVAAFIDVVARRLGAPTDLLLAYGLTSSDLVDTGMMIACRDSLELTHRNLIEFMDKISAMARTHAATICVGRTHGQPADLTTFGHKMATFYYDLTFVRDSMKRHMRGIGMLGMLSGPVGSHTYAPESVAKRALADLNVTPIPIASQVISRVPVAMLVQDLALLSGVLSKWAINFRLLMQAEIGELILSKGSAEKGSSSMPHKTNPAGLEKITGLHRLVEGYSRAVSDGIQLWGERDISHSSVERIAIPDAFHAVANQLRTFHNTLDNLKVNTLRMQGEAEECPNSHWMIHELIDTAQMAQRSGRTRAGYYEKARNVERYGSVGIQEWWVNVGDIMTHRINVVTTL